ncbi:MAG TPA: dihydrolipoyl dehydrogenase [Methanothrix sp.]|nr:dihydrolipoyl dehydrogenase [Methanothrix sp.]
MEEFDLIVIGSGAGTNVASGAAENGLNVALVDQGPTGGTCLNSGCIPSKMLIYPADVIRSIQDAREIGVHAKVDEVDFKRIMSRMHDVVDRGRSSLEQALENADGLTYVKERAEFVEDYVLKTGVKEITSGKIVVASGARPLVPAIPGLLEAGFLDNISLLQLERLPRSLIIIGGGYIACEFGHFFSALGVDVTIIGRHPLLLKGEDPEVARLVSRKLSLFMRIVTGYEVISVERDGDHKMVSARDIEKGGVLQFRAEEILLAAGRQPNSDLLHPEKSGIKTDRQGWIVVDRYLETDKVGIYALGDALGKHMYRHTANYEAEVVMHNLLHTDGQSGREEVDYHAVPYAVFTYPTVAGVGMKEWEAESKGLKVLIGRANYTDTAKGLAMGEESGLVKAVLEEETGRILGITVAGAAAAEMAQQAVYLMNTDYMDLTPVLRSQVIHPTLNEVLVRAFSRLQRPKWQA